MDRDYEYNAGAGEVPPGGAHVGTAEEEAKEIARINRRIEELKQQMTPEKRKMFEDLEKLRNEIGVDDFDVVQAIRELRDDV